MPKKKPQIIELNTAEAVDLAIEKADSVSTALELKVNSQPTFLKASEFMGTLREVKKFLKEKKDSILKPLKTAKENAEALFEPAETKVATIENYLKDQIQKYDTQLKIQEAERLAKAEQDLKDGKTIDQVTNNLEKVQTKMAAIPTTTVYEITIVDFAKVPNEFKILDEPKARQAAKAGLKVEGLEFKKIDKVVNRF